jgi:hypothetical protein
MVISPRESFATVGHVTYVFSVLVFFLVLTAFDVVREVDKHMGNGTWISVSDKEKIKSVILSLYVFALMLSRGTGSREHMALGENAGTLEY